MLSAIKKFFSSSMSPAPEAEGKEAAKDIRLAACALLLELANADDEFAQQAREEADDLWQFTNLIAENYSTGQKMVLAEIMWGLVYSDGDLASKEDYLMRKICNLLRLEPGYLAEARQRYADGNS